MTIVWWVVGVLVAVAVVIVGAGVILTALLVSGGPSTDLICSDDLSGTERTVRSTPQLSDALQTKIDALEDQLDLGQSGLVSFDESDTTSRATQFALANGLPVTEIVICFHDNGIVEGRAKVDLGEISDFLGVFGGSVKARALGTVDFSGPHPVVTINEIDVGSAPGFAIDIAEGPIEDIINEALEEEVNLDHDFGLLTQEGSAQLSGSP